MCGDVRRYANFRICGIISAYAILKTQLYVEKYATCAIVCSHINGIPITVQVYSMHCWPRKYSVSRFKSADTLRPYWARHVVGAWCWRTRVSDQLIVITHVYYRQPAANASPLISLAIVYMSKRPVGCWLLTCRPPISFTNHLRCTADCIELASGQST